MRLRKAIYLTLEQHQHKNSQYFGWEVESSSVHIVRQVHIVLKVKLKFTPHAASCHAYLANQRLWRSRQSDCATFGLLNICFTIMAPSSSKLHSFISTNKPISINIKRETWFQRDQRYENNITVINSNLPTK